MRRGCAAPRRRASAARRPVRRPGRPPRRRPSASAVARRAERIPSSSCAGRSPHPMVPGCRRMTSR
ncbi:MAG: hypothetical protein C0502_04930 [Opitutus sp.]|nr:hypothetical protein [Opitutus sp.]